MNQTKLIPKSSYTSDKHKLDYRRFIRKILNGEFAYIFGRFNMCRKYYSRSRKFQELFMNKQEDNKFNLEIEILNSDNWDTKEICSHIRQNSYYDQLQLNQQSVATILESAKTRKLKIPEKSVYFTYTEYEQKIKPYHKVAIAHVDEPIAIEEVHKLRYNKYLLEIASQYLGYLPTDCNVRLWWSFADNISLGERRKQSQTIDYHYDVHGFNFFYVSFYLTDVDVKSGAHVLVKGSHINKKISMLLGSARVTDEFIDQNYSATDIITLEGKAGKCFLEDTSCFHKALPPTDNNRLLLQLRYF